LRLTKLTNPTTLPISLNDVKDHIRVERDESSYDEDLTELIYAAQEYIEDETHLTLITTQLRATWDMWPAVRIKVPGWPVSAIDSITYTDVDGNAQTLSDSLYRTSLVQCPATVIPAIDQDWPDLQVDAIDAVNINFTAGYGTAATDQPYMIRHLLKLLVGHWFKHREAVGSSMSHEVELAFRSLRNQTWVGEFEEYLIQ
jgi:uncharacterized phiE125 gp8 family phage protein